MEPTKPGSGTLKAETPDGLLFEAKTIEFFFPGDAWKIDGYAEDAYVSLAFPPDLKEGANIINYPADLDFGGPIEEWSYRIAGRTENVRNGTAAILITTVNGLRSVKGFFEFHGSEYDVHLLTVELDVKQLSK